MRKTFILVLIALLLGVGVVAVIETDPGYVLIAYGNYTVETSLWVGLVVLLLFTLAVYAVVRLLRRLVGGQHSLVSWWGHRRSRASSRALRPSAVGPQAARVAQAAEIARVSIVSRRVMSGLPRGKKGGGCVHPPPVGEHT